MLNVILKKVTKPYQYVGREYNSHFGKEKFLHSDVKMALLFPDVYEIGASNFGLKVLYELINRNENFFADRAFAPCLDFLLELENNDLPLFGLDSQVPLCDFNFVGFSLQYELFYPTCLKMLELSKIPIFNSHRTENSPIIIAGGPCTYNPAPMSKFIDLFIIGDGDDVNLELMEYYLVLKKKGTFSRNDIIKKLSEIKGIYSSLYSKNIVSKRVSDLNIKNAPIKPVVPFSSCIHDRAVVEIRRGCGRMCRFCQAGHTGLPIRERDVSDVKQIAMNILQNSGYDEISLLSLSSNDYSYIEPLLDILSFNLSKKNVSISLPSQRIDKFNINIAKNINKVRKSTITLAPEAGSERLRKVINKNLSEQQIIDTIITCYKSGFSAFKLYFMVGLPNETLEDICELAKLLKKLFLLSKNIKKEFNLTKPLSLTVSLSIFVPKPFTPFQWCPQDSLENIDFKINYLKDLTRNLKNLKINYHNKFVSRLEAVLTRGDSSFCDFIFQMYKSKQYLISWEENIDFKIIEEIFNHKLDIIAGKTFSLDEKLPWDVISCGINKDWFIDQYKLALNEININPCETKCVNCGVCKNLNVKRINSTYCDNSFKNIVTFDTNVDKKYSLARVKYKKSGNLKYISHLDIQNTIMKMLNRSNLDIEYTSGFNPTIKISFSNALGVYNESSSEFFDFYVNFNDNEYNLLKILNDNVPYGLEVLNVSIFDKKPLSLDKLTFCAVYKISIDDFSEKIYENFENLMYIKRKICSSDFTVEKKNKKGISKTVYVSDSLVNCEVVNDNLYLALKTGNLGDVTPLRVDLILNYANDKHLPLKIERIAFLDKNLKVL